jgi:hypothetical protein
VVTRLNLSDFMDQFVYTLGRHYSRFDLDGTGGLFAGHHGHRRATYHGVTGGCEEFHCDCGDVIFVRLVQGRVAPRHCAWPPVRCTWGYRTKRSRGF